MTSWSKEGHIGAWIGDPRSQKNSVRYQWEDLAAVGGPVEDLEDLAAGRTRP